MLRIIMLFLFIRNCKNDALLWFSEISDYQHLCIKRLKRKLSKQASGHGQRKLRRKIN